MNPTSSTTKALITNVYQPRHVAKSGGLFVSMSSGADDSGVGGIFTGETMGGEQ
ncbi:hypothetical protein [Hymenobacter radiodurans]|uniref:hypothetical protein n=1 Tax=Hymenobacter radiodurans TaxID=2496028 RepID=UPI0014054886|nr:hypothetical protein [Hymenobacter radiodurans]